MQVIEDHLVITSRLAIDPASTKLPVMMALNTKVSTLPVMRQLIAFATDRVWASRTRIAALRDVIADPSAVFDGANHTALDARE